MIDRACVSLNNTCNLKCKYCHFQDKQGDYYTFDFENLKIIVNNIHKYCKKNNLKKFKLGIVGSGEPMLQSELILEMLNYIIQKEMFEFDVYTITNGTLLSIDLLQSFYLYKDFFKICISLDGYEELHNSGRMAYFEVMKGIQNYYKVFGCMPSINSTINLLSYLNKEKLIDFYKKNKLYNVTFSKLSGYYQKDLYITDNQFSEFMKYAEECGIKSRQFRKEKCYDCTMYGKLCGVGRTNIFIAPDGVFPCGRFYKNKKYLLGSCNDSFVIIEKKVKKMNPVVDGKCYYIENVEVR